MWKLEEIFQTQHALNDDQCPKKMMGASDALQSHTWCCAHTEAQNKRHKQAKET